MTEAHGGDADVTPNTCVPDGQESAQADDSAGRGERFEQLIRGEYKREFDESVKRASEERVKDLDELRANAERVKPILDALKRVYGDADEAQIAEKLESAVMGDTPQAPAQDATIGAEEAPLEHGARGEALARDMRARGVISRWRADAEETRRAYPEFSLEREITDPKFSRLLRAGVDVKTAYEVAHQGELIGGAMRLTAEKIREKTVSDILSRGARPYENGDVGRSASALRAARVGDMTRDEREAIEKRCARGERIYFEA